MAATAQESAFCGLYALVITIPWSLAFGAIIDQVIPKIFDESIIPGVSIILISGFINIAIILSIEKAIKRASANTAEQDAAANP